MAADRTDKRAGSTAPGSTRLPPIGFWSYARQDDELSFGKLSSLRSLLIHELQQQYGREPIQLFQDASTIPHGSDWEREIQKAIDLSVFFIPIITPNFIQSEWCAREVELFLEREQRLFARHPGLSERSRIFPILFIDIDDADAENPEALAALQKLQWFDFRRFRHRSYEEAAVREALSELAGTIRALLKTRLTTPAATAAPPADDAAPPPATEESAPREADAGAPSGPAVPSRPIATGDLLNHMFEVKRFIKAGGMGQVFEGANIMTGERVAIKALLPALAADPKITALFQREAITLTRLNHEALVQYRALAKEPVLGSLYIVTEYVDGVDLGDALGTAARTAPVLKHLLGRLAAGLAAAHRLGAIHRDISPDNVMLPGGDIGQARIIDFGIAKDLGGNLPTLIGEGFAGKLNYVAPEQLGEYGGEIGPWTDVYSLALVILAVAGGEKLDMSGSFADAIRKRRDGPDLAAAPDELRPLLADMLHADPAKRLRSMDEVIARLKAAAQPAAPVALPPAPAAPPAVPEPAPDAPVDVIASPPRDEAETVVVDPPAPPPPPAAPVTPAFDRGEMHEQDPLRRLRGTLLFVLIATAIVAILGVFVLTRSGDSTPQPQAQAQPPSEAAIVTLASGVRYRVVIPGSGPTVTPSDLVTLRFRMRANSLDGPILAEAGYSEAPAVMRPVEMVPGLADAMVHMRQGSNFIIWLPPGTAYTRPPPGAPFTARDTLIFDLQVLEIGPGPASTGAGQTAPMSGAVTAARPERTNLATYFTVADYPQAALRQGAQGTTGFNLTIGTDGRVADCQITVSSGSGALDEATCRILRSRARYVPARDASGQPTTGSDSGRVAWRLPDTLGD